MHFVVGFFIVAAILNSIPGWMYYIFAAGLFFLFYSFLETSPSESLDCERREESSKARAPSRSSRSILSPSGGRGDLSKWASQVLADSGEFLIIDTETTGLSGRDEVIEIAIIRPNGDAVFRSHIKPPKRRKMPPEAEKIHGITLAFLKDKPTLADVWAGIERAVHGKILIAYNAEFDERLLRQTCKKYDLPALKNKWECAMLHYAAWVGEWNDYRNDYKWQKLPSAGHNAFSDCLATRKVIVEMAGGKA